jgi:hypothetical protein
MNATTTTRTPWLAMLLLPALALAAPAGAAKQQGTFTARITVTSQCDTQQALFGPQAQRNVTVICQPGFTPYQTQSIDLGDNDSKKAAQGSSVSEPVGQNAGGPSFNPSATKELSPPLPSAATFASKLIFVVF